MTQRVAFGEVSPAGGEAAVQDRDLLYRPLTPKGSKVKRSIYMVELCG